jgi:ubiquinone/menaquinone biosynthesis C-methylase UbiE
MFSSAFSVLDTHLTHVRGRDNLTAYAQSRTIASGNIMTNYFCSTCGTLMYRVGTKGATLLRIGTVDDFHLHETKLMPKREIWCKDRVDWLGAVEGTEKYEGSRLASSRVHLTEVETKARTLQNTGLSDSQKKDTAQSSRRSNYTQGYSNYTTATQQLRTAESGAAFLIPHIKKTDRILDIGCGPGTITTSLAKYASEGATVGIDISTAVLEKAKILAAEANVPTQGPGSVVFKEGNILERLPYPDGSFDIAFASQVFGHLHEPDLQLRAITEIRRVLKPGGIVATRDGAGPHFHPRSLNLDRLWGKNQARALHRGHPDLDGTGMRMPALFRKAGFDADGGKVHIGAGSTVFAGLETRKWLAWRAAGQLKEGDPVRQSWLDAGISADEIQETLVAVEKWAVTEDAWFASLECEMLAWK